VGSEGVQVGVAACAEASAAEGEAARDFSCENEFAKCELGGCRYGIDDEGIVVEAG
jgi:hypothetical protein